MRQKITDTLLSLIIIAIPTSVMAAEVCGPDKTIPHFETSVTALAVFKIGESSNKRLCRTAEAGDVSSLKHFLWREGVVLGSSGFWAIKCKKPSGRLTIEPNLLQAAILNNNITLTSQTLRELDSMDNLSFTMVNEFGDIETPLDWIDRQIEKAQPSMKIRFKRIRRTLVTEFNAKTLDELKASGMCVAPPLPLK